MKWIILYSILAFSASVSATLAKPAAKVAPKPAAKIAAPAKTTAAKVLAKKAPKKSKAEVAFAKAIQLFQKADYVNAAPKFYYVSRAMYGKPMGIVAKFNFGLCMKKIGLRQTAAFAFIDVARRGEDALKKKAFDNLVAVANSLDETSLLNFALAHVSSDTVSETGSAIYEYRLGEMNFRNKEYEKALASFHKSLQYKSTWDEPLYSLGMTHLAMKQPELAMPFFERLIQLNGNKLINDPKWGTAVLGLARSYYQNRQWRDAVDTYRLIPKDSPLYRQSLMELSWALFRGGQLRSALSPLETLHTPYYAQFYDPESLILKGIIQLFVCHYDEMESVLNTFASTYPPAHKSILDFFNIAKTPADYFKEVEATLSALEKLKKTGILKTETTLPFMVMRTIVAEHDVRILINYMKKLNAERKLLLRLYEKQPQVLAYGEQVLKGRRATTARSIGLKVENHLKDKLLEISDFASQMEFLNYEKLNGQRTVTRAKLQTDPSETVDAEVSRTFYVQNGYRYWPFQGEYWRDELGNYQYLGENSCAHKR